MTDPAYFQSIIQGATSGIITINNDGIIETFNPAAEKIFGYNAVEIIGKNVSELMYNPHYTHHTEYIHNYFRTKEKNVVDQTRKLIARHSSGSKLTIELIVKEFSHHGTLKFTGFVQDLTREMVLLNELQIGLSQFRDIIDTAPIGVIVFNSDEILYVNDKCAKIFGYSTPHELEGKNVEILQPEDLRSNFIAREALRHVGSTNIPLTERYQTKGLRCDGLNIDIEVNFKRIIMPQGPGTLGFISNISLEENLKRFISHEFGDFANFPFLLAKMGKIGPEIIYRDFDELECQPNGDLNSYLSNILINTITALGRGTDYSVGIAQLPSGECDCHTLIVYTTRLNDVEAEDSRLKYGYFQYVCFVDKKLLSLIQDFNDLEQVFKIYHKNVTTAEELKPVWIEHLKEQVKAFIIS